MPTPERRGEDQRRRQEEPVYDAIELSDEDLEYVVGGLSLDAVMAQARYLKQAWGEE